MTDQRDERRPERETATRTGLIHGKTLRVAVLAVVLAAAAIAVAFSWPTWFDDDEPAVAVAGGDPELGRDALREYGCIACHSVPGVRGPDAYVGPPLTAWAERIYIAGSLPNEPDNLVYWIQFPDAVEPGTAMPTLGVSEEDARDIAAYLYTLE